MRCEHGDGVNSTWTLNGEKIDEVVKACSKVLENFGHKERGSVWISDKSLTAATAKACSWQAKF
jgi:hypothetical protein